MELNIVVGDCFEIIEEDDELVEQFPELTVGTQFKVVHMICEGIVAIQIKNGPYLSIAENPNAWFWCFWMSDNYNQIKKIEELASDPIDVIKHMGIFGGRRISTCLIAQAGQENNDGYEGNLMQAAGEYIEWLERQLAFSDRGF